MGLATLFASFITIAAPSLNEAPQPEGVAPLELGGYSAEQPIATEDRHFGTRDALDSTNSIASTSKHTFFAAAAQSGGAGGGGAAGPNVADDHGDQASASTDISSGTPVQGMIGAADDADYFRLILGQPSLVSIYTTGELDTVGRLIDSDGREVAANDDSGKMANFRIEANLDPGIHYLQMRAVANATGSYELNADVRTSAPARIGNSVGMEFALVPAGEFYMGSDSGEARERPVRRVQISRAFYMGQHEVTAEQWDAVMGSNRSSLSECGPDCPVVGVSWQEAREFVRRLNAAEGETRYRLPTEGEWEYAARAGTGGDRYAPDLDLIAWYRSNSQGQIHPVGTWRANAFGLHDMLGNAWEWVEDAYGPYQPHPAAMLTDPTGPAINEARAAMERVIRGGGSGSSEWEIRASQRNAGRQDRAFEGLDAGFRLAMSLEAQTGSGAWAADDHGDGPSQATPLAIGTAAVGRIGPGDEVDYFSLEVSEPTAVAIDTRGSLDTYGSLRDSANSMLAGDDDGGEEENFRIETTLDAGVHYVRVGSHRNVEGVYTLRVERRAAASPPTDEFTNSMGMEFALVPAGEFDMGSAGGEQSERPVTRVRISRAFYMGKHEVTQGQWEAVMGSNPSEFTECGWDCPVESVSWVEAREFVRRLNAKEDTTLYRLPTEAEWEYAARAGTSEERYWPDVNEIAWHAGNSGETPHPVGQKRANDFGLYDMAGNVWEWTRDQDRPYPGGTVTDPFGDGQGSRRVSRGGGVLHPAHVSRAAMRSFTDSSIGAPTHGLRLAMSVQPQDGLVAQDHDDHSNLPSGATPLTIGTPMRGRIEEKGDVDYFSLNLSEETTVAVYTTGSVDTSGVVYDSRGRLVAENDNRPDSQDINFRIEATVAAGVYYVRVESRGEETGDYSLHVERRAAGSAPPAALTNSIGMAFALIPAGEFDMGSTSAEADSDERPVTRVRISREFYMGKYEVTQGQWEAVMGSNPSRFDECGPDCPVEWVSWKGVQEYIKRLNAQEGTSQYRLPTEAEWEYAARAGTTGDRYDSDLGVIAWYGENSGGAPHPVGEKKANAFGLHDMLGNVWEWANDWAGAEYTGGMVTDPTGPSTGSRRVDRGGGWDGRAWQCRATARGYNPLPSYRANNLGFRLVMSLDSQQGIDLSDATPLAIGSSVTGRIEHGNEVDYFSFEVSEPTDVAIYTTGSLGTTGTLLDSTGREVASDIGGEDINFRIEATVAAGVYYVRVESRGEETGDYSLHVERRAAGSAPPAALTNSIGMAFALIPAGEFDMGSTSAEAYSNEQPVTRVRISSGFYLGKYEVTQGQWEAVMGSNPSHFDNCGPDCPVEQVSWNAVQVFIQRLNEREGTSKYRLPTEAEWEYAARAGTTGDRYDSDLGAIAWYEENSGGTPHAVGQKLANSFGLHDMLGNVWEWVHDWFGSYSGGMVTDPTGPSSGTYRVLRGSSWGMDARECRVPNRGWVNRNSGYDILGFRLAISLDAELGILLSDATPLAIGSSATVQVGPGDDVDYFSFEVSEPTNVAIYTTGSLGTIGTLLDSTGREVASDSGGEASNFRIEATVEKGVYYVRVESHGDSTGGYTLHVRPQTAAGTITTVAGTGYGGFSGDGGSATSAGLNVPTGVAVYGPGILYIADFYNDRVRRVDLAGVITTVAGTGSTGFSGDGGLATSARLSGPGVVAVDAVGNLYIADRGNDRVRRVDAETGVITTVAGTGSRGFSGDGGPATSAELNDPVGVVVDGVGNLYIADMRNHRVRRVDAETGVITTVAGTGSEGFSGDSGPAPSAELRFPSGVVVDGTGNLYIADEGEHRVRRVDLAGVITTVAGTGSEGFSGDSGPATSAELAFPSGVAVDSAGNLYIADDGNHRVRRVDLTGTITTVAGTSSRGFSGDGGPATSAELDGPIGVAVDGAGNLYIAESYNHRVRRVEFRGGSVVPPALADYHGNEPLEATPLAIGTSVVGRIGPGDDVDYFSLEVSKPTDVAIYTAGSLDTLGSIRDRANAKLAGDDDSGGGSNFWIETTLRPGTHYLRVESYHKVEGVYTLFVEGSVVETPPALEVTNTLGMDFALVPAGEFEMGSSTGTDHERPVTHVRISRGFYLGKQEVTQGQWEAVMGSKPSVHSACGADCPVAGVSWVEAQEFVRRLNEREGTTLYRLPTEAEWEYAARAGTTGERYWPSVDEIAWHEANSDDTPHPVGQKRPNAFGLHDMLGNVWEWVWDWSGAYLGEAVTDPLGPSTGLERISRGGGFSNPANESRASERSSGTPSERFRNVGLRLAISLQPQAGYGAPGAADDHGDEYWRASEFKGTSESGQIDRSGDLDYFRLEFPEKTDVTIYTTGSLGTAGSLLDSTNSQMTSDIGGDGINFRIEASVEAGEYYVSVESPSASSGSYTLHVEKRTVIRNRHGMEFVLVPAGKFSMGSIDGESDERPVREVRISKAFYMGRHEVTQGQWEAVMGSNPSRYRTCGADCPVERVSWEDAQEFVRLLNEQEGTTRYRLPTEAEWEYAARAGREGELSSTELEQVAWLNRNTRAPRPVGLKRANGFGLHDMQGNLWEWVHDWYGDSYGQGPVTDPTGPATGSTRVRRGGSWYDGPRYCRLANRYDSRPGLQSTNLGLRLALTAAALPEGAR